MRNVKNFVTAMFAIAVLLSMFGTATFAQTESVILEVAAAQPDEAQVEAQRDAFMKFFGQREEARLAREFQQLNLTAAPEAALNIQVAEGSHMGKATFVAPGFITVSWVASGTATSCTIRNGAFEIGTGLSGSAFQRVDASTNITGFCTMPNGAVADSFIVVVATTGPTSGTIGVCEPGALVAKIGETVQVFFEHNLSTQNVVWAASGGFPDFDPAGVVGYYRTFSFSSPGIKTINAAAMADGRRTAGFCQVQVLAAPYLTAPTRGGR